MLVQSKVEITPSLVKEFWKDALNHFGAISLDKKSSDFMRIVGTFLDRMGIIEKNKFLNSYTTTIFTTIYRPFEIGVEGNGKHSLEWQILTCVHELVHVTQYKENPIGFAPSYLANKSSRADYEAQAFSADLELYYYLNGKLYDIERRSKVLSNYGLEEEHCEFAKEFMESVAKTIVQGASVNEVAAWAIEWFEKRK